ncbi:adenylate isopentenyltransferase-like [Salvia hispanica]|uniref:adenylate isopentenyltransferase-like n=1 Tax=Salvia hispanica TaxID=49212 RepID=UPI002009A6D0|nr:adenylate isopentenyltransferase-like [Salvia hispanica]
MASRRHKKVVIVMGPTGCGKTKLSLDLASRFFPSSEIINADKIQTHRGLPITTNKVPLSDRLQIPHHLLGSFQSSPSHPELTPSDFRLSASSLISQILSRRNTPIIVGGSNSFIYALLAKSFRPDSDVFTHSNSPICKGLRYRCCFIWVDASPAVLTEYLASRVDEMMEAGMLDELEEFFGSGESDSVSGRGLGRAIGVPEFRRYFQTKARGDGDVAEREAYVEAVRAIKDNTCQLAKRQLAKILRLRDSAGWDLKRVDATEALRAAMAGRKTAEHWEREVVEPSRNIVKRFLMGE